MKPKVRKGGAYTHQDIIAGQANGTYGRGNNVEVPKQDGGLYAGTLQGLTSDESKIGHHTVWYHTIDHLCDYELANPVGAVRVGAAFMLHTACEETIAIHTQVVPYVLQQNHTSATCRINPLTNSSAWYMQAPPRHQTVSLLSTLSLTKFFKKEGM